MRGGRRMSTLILSLACGAAHATTAETLSARDLPGLVAWYDARSLYGEDRKLQDGETVKDWEDSSGNGHDLRTEARGLPAVFRTKRLNDLPLVELQKSSSFLVANPFGLNDHTIVIVAATSTDTRALFSSDANDQFGVVLSAAGGVHRIQDGRGAWAYNSEGPQDGFSVIALTRGAGALNSVIDGTPRSADAQGGGELRVGRLFDIRLSKMVKRDAAGLSVAELIFFDRRLEDDELSRLTGRLASKWGLDGARAGPASDPLTGPREGQASAFDWSRAEPLARLSTLSEPDLNVPNGRAIAWDAPAEVAGPFRHDREHHLSRLYCTRDNTRVQLAVILELAASQAGARLRIGTLKNGKAYLPHAGVTHPTADGADGMRLSARYESSLAMNADDYVEIVVSRDGADGRVSALPLSSFFLAAVE